MIQKLSRLLPDRACIHNVRRRPQSHRPSVRYRPGFEPLERRHLLTTFVVDTPWDDPSAAANDTDGLVSLREAITAANLNFPFGDATAGESTAVDRIMFAPALAGLTIQLEGEELSIDDDLILDGLGRDVLGINAQHLSRVLSVAPDTTVEIARLAITHGSDGGSGGIGNSGTLTIRDSALRWNEGAVGGAILNEGMLEVISSVIEHNLAEYGGAIENFGSVIVRDSQIRENIADFGGAIDNDGGTLSIDSSFVSRNRAEVGGAITNYFGSLTVAGSTLEQNEATKSGGAAYSYYSTAVFSNSFVKENRAGGDGGGLFSERGNVTVAASSFSGNAAHSGAAIRNRDGSVVVEASSFFENIAGLYGGAIESTAPNAPAALTIEGSAFAANRAAFGGAVESIDTDLRITNSTFSGNSALRDGGAIRNFGPLQISHCTITGNRADADGNDALPEGGGLYNGPSFLLRGRIDNTILAGNFQGTGDQPNDVGGLVNASGAHNLIGDAGTAGGLSHAANGNIVGNAGIGTIGISLVLDTQLADNGGPTWTHALVAGSPAVDAADSTQQFDQRGSQRGLDGNDDGILASDIGAYERLTFGSVMTPLEQQIRSLRGQGFISNGDLQSLLNFLERTRFHVGCGELSQAQHFLDLLIGKVERLADSQKLPAATANGLAGFARTIRDHFQATIDQHRALDALFADFVFDWDWAE